MDHDVNCTAEEYAREAYEAARDSNPYGYCLWCGQQAETGDDFCSPDCKLSYARDVESGAGE